MPPVNPVIAGIMLGVAFAALDLAWLWPMEEWRSGVERLQALSATVLVRFTTGFLAGAIDVGLSGWVFGVLIGGVLSLLLIRFDRAPVRVLAIGLSGGLWVGVMASVLREGGAFG